MKIKTTDLIGPALDWAVTYAEMLAREDRGEHIKSWVCDGILKGEQADPYSIDWLWGGPIIEREKIEITYWHQPNQWQASTNERIQYDERGEFIEGSDFQQFGHTALIAAMRCYVAFCLGDEVEIPNELVGEAK